MLRMRNKKLSFLDEYNLMGFFNAVKGVILQCNYPWQNIIQK
jgi:hypothetical protein